MFDILPNTLLGGKIKTKNALEESHSIHIFILKNFLTVKKRINGLSHIIT